MGELLKVFAAVFLAELGDKTQLAVIGFASSGKPWLTFLGASAALVVITALGCAAGSLLGKYVPPRVMNLIAGALFVGIGVLHVIKALR